MELLNLRGRRVKVANKDVEKLLGRGWSHVPEGQTYEYNPVFDRANNEVLRAEVLRDFNRSEREVLIVETI